MKLGLYLGLLLGTATVNAEPIVTGDWLWETGQEFNYAGTINDSNHVLGQYCYIESGNCIYVASFDASCDENSSYPGIVNSDLGSASIELVCSHANEDQHVYIISSFDDIDLIVRGANKIGIAFPLEGDRFLVSRFSLNGSNRAIDAMREKTSRMMDELPDQEYL